MPGRFRSGEPARAHRHHRPHLGSPDPRVNYAAANRGHRHGHVVCHKQQTLTRWPHHDRHPGKKTDADQPKQSLATTTAVYQDWARHQLPRSASGARPSLSPLMVLALVLSCIVAIDVGVRVLG